MLGRGSQRIPSFPDGRPRAAHPTRCDVDRFADAIDLGHEGGKMKRKFLDSNLRAFIVSTCRQSRLLTEDDHTTVPDATRHPQHGVHR
jgi:hypothetical protein